VHRYSNGIVFFSYLMASGLDEVLDLLLAWCFWVKVARELTVSLIS
jgi:hypothetical protein